MRVAAYTNQRRSGAPQGLIARGMRSRVVALPAPTTGWNARDALTAMLPTDAIELDNFIPDVGGVRLRNGYASHVTGLNGHVESLMEYNPPSGTVKLKAATSDSIYDVTTAGAVGAAEVSGLSNARWQHVMMATTGGNFLVICNGADSVRNYDGSSWTTPSITGVTSSTLINVTSHFARLWFVQKDTLDAWYLDTAAISGAATKFPIGPLCKRGGHLLAIASWTRDGGAGMEDFLVFVTSRGEALVYSGTDPDDAATWLKVGTFKIAEPIGRRCVINLGSDIGIITSQGVVPFSKVMPLPETAQGQVAATDKIANAFKEAYQGAGAEFGWQVVEYPKEQLAIINVPVVPQSTFYQFVMNTQNQAWCRFKSIEANCWSLKGADLYFGGNTIVYKYGDVFADNGAEINATAIGAYVNLGSPNNKAVVQAKPMITAAAGYSPFVALRVDYDTGTINYVAAASETGGTFWDEGDWDVSEWAVGIVKRAKWQTLYAFGSVFSFAITASSQERFEYNAVDLMVQDAGFTQ